MKEERKGREGEERKRGRVEKARVRRAKENSKERAIEKGKGSSGGSAVRRGRVTESN